MLELLILGLVFAATILRFYQWWWDAQNSLWDWVGLKISVWKARRETRTADSAMFRDSDFPRAMWNTMSDIGAYREFDASKVSTMWDALLPLARHEARELDKRIKKKARKK